MDGRFLDSGHLVARVFWVSCILMALMVECGSLFKNTHSFADVC